MVAYLFVLILVISLIAGCLLQQFEEENGALEGKAASGTRRKHFFKKKTRRGLEKKASQDVPWFGKKKTKMM